MGNHPLFLSLTISPRFSCSHPCLCCRIIHVMSIERDERPWGAYDVLEEGPHYKVKRIEVKPGHRLSLQMHQSRSEHWVIVTGEAIATIGEKEIPLRVNEVALIPARTKHRVANPGTGPLVFIDVQCGDYLGEDDITRFEDDYNRMGVSDNR